MSGVGFEENKAMELVSLAKGFLRFCSKVYNYLTIILIPHQLKFTTSLSIQHLHSTPQFH